jgi:glycosyltransferase involved in cell wall biosynthesis
VVLNAICGPGPADYRRSVERRIDKLRLGGVVNLLPDVPRRDLLTAYQSHDALLFHSVFPEPVALVSAEALAAGLPVVAPLPTRASALIRPGHTAHCFDSSSPEVIAAAVERLLVDTALRNRLRAAGHRLVQREFSLTAMGAAYDVALRSLLSGPAS